MKNSPITDPLMSVRFSKNELFQNCFKISKANYLQNQYNSGIYFNFVGKKIFLSTKEFHCSAPPPPTTHV